MKKLKNLWKNNKILMILGAILLVCLIAIIVVVLTYFVGTKKSVYGNRFDNMKTKITEKEQNAYIKSLEDNSSVSKVRFRVFNKSIKVSVTFKDDIKLDDAKKIIDTSLEKLSDPVKETYDVNFYIENTSFKLMGARNASGNGLFWSNNTPVESK
jgi:hypothetical protein